MHVHAHAHAHARARARARSCFCTDRANFVSRRQDSKSEGAAEPTTKARNATRTATRARYGSA
eukprot:10632876-Alexandrium_andersonii.AAC.1